jgi:hypothetical protein
MVFLKHFSYLSTAWRRWLPGVAATRFGGHLVEAAITRWWMVFLNDLS